jgi:hypothetical protein
MDLIKNNKCQTKEFCFTKAKNATCLTKGRKRLNVVASPKANSSNIRARQKQRTKKFIDFTKSRMAKINVGASPKANKIKHSLHQKQQIKDMRFTKSNKSKLRYSLHQKQQIKDRRFTKSNKSN